MLRSGNISFEALSSRSIGSAETPNPFRILPVTGNNPIIKQKIAKIPAVLFFYRTVQIIIGISAVTSKPAKTALYASCTSFSETSAGGMAKYVFRE